MKPNGHANTPGRCDLCEKEFEVGDTFVDGRVCSATVWADMCEDCFFVRGVGLGIGVRQRFKVNEEDSFEKTDPQECQWFLACHRPVEGTLDHPTLGDVPICGPCRQIMEAL